MNHHHWNKQGIVITISTLFICVILPSIPSSHSYTPNTIITNKSPLNDNTPTKTSSTTTTTAIIPRRTFLRTTTLLSTLLLPATPSHATTRSKTGIILPSPGEISSAIPSPWPSSENPFLSLDSTSAFSRLDSSPDSLFYSSAKIVEHVDDNAVRLMTEYLKTEVLESGDRVLDVGASWTSHFNLETKRRLMLTRVVGLGMNEEELNRNEVLDEWVVTDLNDAARGAKLPFADESFDKVLCQLSVDYFVRPLEVMKEVARVLKPGGSVVILFSNRLFLSKAVGLWTGADDIDHAYTVGAYLRFCDGGFEDIKAIDLSTRKGRDKAIVGDPLYAVTARIPSKTTTTQIEG